VHWIFGHNKNVRLDAPLVPLHHLAHSLGANGGAGRGSDSASSAAARLLDSKGTDKCTFLRVHKAQFGRTIKLRTIDTAAFEPNQGAQESNIKSQSRTAKSSTA
jgi:hypothetical protein